MDEYHEVWRWIFPITALISLSTIWLQLRIPISSDTPVERAKPEPVVNHILKPWKEAITLLRERSDYALYQIGFMIAGFGVMLWQPALPVFFMDTLNLSYTELATAIALCKGVGYVIASPLWANLFNRSTIFRFYGTVSFLFCLFPLLLILAPTQLLWLYVAYILYGVTQSASEMSWSLSGPAFAQDQEDSSVYSSINVLSVGLRGCIAPPLGSYLLAFGGSKLDMLLGSFLCFIAAVHMIVCATRKFQIPIALKQES
jgi:predicted MFS family arabinose efflux permease